MYFVATLIFSVIFFLSGCSTPRFLTRASATTVLPKPATDGQMQLLWGNDVKQAALHLIDSSHRKVYLEMYELSDSGIIAALKQAKARNEDVRVVLDATEKHSTQTGYPELHQDGVNVRKIAIKQGIDHLKMLVTDDGVLIGGMNYGSQSWNNNDASVLIKQPNSSFNALFLWDFARANGEVAAAPDAKAPLVYDRSIEPAILQAIRSATTSVDIEAFDLSERDVTKALQMDLARKVVVNILVDPTQRYSKTAVTTLRNSGAVVRYYRPATGELMHAKILDADHGRTFIIGSANFSHQAYTYNHEADIVLHDVPHFDASFRQDLEAQLGRGSDYPVKGTKENWG